MNKQSQIAGMKGFSLIELMIGITLGLLIMTALVTLFVNTSRTNTEMAKVNSQIENGRFAMQLLTNEIVHGGFWGGYVPQFEDLTLDIGSIPNDVPSVIPSPCRIYDPASPWSTADQHNIIGIPIQAYDAMPPGCVTATATATDSAILTNVADRKANTDVLLIRHAATCLPGVGNCEADVAGKLYFQPSFCEPELAALTPTFLLATTGFTTAGTGRHARTCVGTGTPPALPITSADFADKRKFVSSIYWISSDNTLMRSEFDLASGTLAHKAAEPLINGIEGFRVELGIDNISDNGTDIFTGTPKLYTQDIAWLDEENLTSPTQRGDGSPDNYKRCTTASACTVEDLSNVVAVKIYVLARADVATPGYTDTKVYNLGTTTLGPFNDNFKRHVFSTTVRLNNVSGIRETP